MVPADVKSRPVQSRFLVYMKNYLKSVEVNDVAFFYLENKSTYIVTGSGESFITNRSLNNLEEKLDPRRFFRINRSFIISYKSIERIEPYFGNRLIVFLRPDLKMKALVSREKVSDFKAWLDE